MRICIKIRHNNYANRLATNCPTLTLYPNPTYSGNINLQVNTTGAYTIAIYNLQGTLIMQQYVANGAAKRSLPVAHLASGQYILSIKSNEGNATRMFQIAHPFFPFTLTDEYNAPLHGECLFFSYT